MKSDLMAQSSVIDGHAPKKVSKTVVHLALCIAQIIFGISAVVGTIGLPSFHPLTFALVRESTASLILLTAAHVVSIRAGRHRGLFSGSLQDFPLLTLCGFGIFASQAFYIIGIKLSSAVAASVWQPSQPILTAAVCMLMGWEPVSCNRILGILVAFFGCAIMVMGGGGGGGEAIGGGDGNDNGSFSKTCGQFSFFLNCIGASLYVLASKRIIATGRYECIAITAWSYASASVMMAAFATGMSWSKTLSVFLCSDCDPDNIWHVPPSAIPAIVFFVLMTSSGSYGLITWANKYATGTLVIGYTVMQPVASAIMIETLIILGLYEGCSDRRMSSIKDSRILEFVKPCLDEPDTFTVIGALGVFTGLMVLVLTEPKEEATDAATETESVFEMLELTDYNELEDYRDDDVLSLEGQS